MQGLKVSAGACGAMLPSLERLRLERAAAPVGGSALLAKVRAQLAAEAKAAEAKEEEESDSDADDLCNDEDEDRYIKMLILDYDGTLTTLKMAGKKPGDPPYEPVSSVEVPLFKMMSKDNHVSLYGGQEQLDRMKALFDELAGFDIELRILSYGKKESILISLKAVGLLEYFTSEGGQPGDLVWGVDVPPLSKDERLTKAHVIQDWIKEEGLHPAEVAFLDDQRNNVDEPEKGKDNQGVAQVLCVGHAELHQGSVFTDSEDWIRNICGLGPPA